jgi:hypothetical protein
MSTAVHSTPSVRYFVDSYGESFGLRDGESVQTFRAYDADYPGPFRRPIGPLFGRVTVREVRDWITAHHPEMIEVEAQA